MCSKVVDNKQHSASGWSVQQRKCTRLQDFSILKGLTFLPRFVDFCGKSNDCRMIYIFTQRAQRAQRFYPHSYLRWRWSGRKLRYDERAKRVYGER